MHTCRSGEGEHALRRRAQAQAAALPGHWLPGVRLFPFLAPTAGCCCRSLTHTHAARQQLRAVAPFLQGCLQHELRPG